ncbi:MAG: hypothetical protein K0R08_1418 [Solimicrobium sp.]|jgi:hypothetical protein|nr:hypothetical protein [Solimicrobium sp.]
MTSPNHFQPVKTGSNIASVQRDRLNEGLTYLYRIPTFTRKLAMLPTSHPVDTNRTAFNLSNSSSTEKNSTVDVHVMNLEKRIDDNRLFLESLKRDSGFQNTLTLMHKAGVPEEQLLKFLTGKVSLEECLGKRTGMINFLVRSYEGLEIKFGWLGKSGHFFSGSLANTLSAIFSPSNLEFSEKTHSKMNTLMQVIEEKNNSGKLDLSNADLSLIKVPVLDIDNFNTLLAEFNSISVGKASRSVMLLEKEIDIAFSMIEDGQQEEAIKICEVVHKNARKNCSWLEYLIIKDKLFEAALEISFAGHHKTSRSILNILGTFSSFETSHRTVETFADFLMNYCISSAVSPAYSRKMVKSLEQASAAKVNLKFTPYFLGKVFEKGLYGVPQNEEKAQKYLGIAAERQYEPRSVRKSRETYVTILEAQQSHESVFSFVPRDIIDHITRLRLGATLAQSAPEKKI